MIGSIQRDRLRELLKIPAGLDILLVIALGQPKETVVLEEIGPGGRHQVLAGRSGGAPRAQATAGGYYHQLKEIYNCENSHPSLKVLTSGLEIYLIS